MTNYELDKLAKGVAKYLLEEIKSNDDLLDTLFPPKTMDIKEAATFLRLPIGTLYQKAREIPHLKAGRKLLFTDRGLMRWLQKQ